MSDAYAAASGPLARFVGRAAHALGDAGGKWWGVGWKEVEDAFRFSELEHYRTSERDVIQVIIAHSPGRANLSPEVAAAALASADQRDKQKRSQAPAIGPRSPTPRIDENGPKS